MMKKYSFLIVTIFSIMLLSACSNDSRMQPSLDDYSVATKIPSGVATQKDSSLVEDLVDSMEQEADASNAKENFEKARYYVIAESMPVVHPDGRTIGHVSGFADGKYGCVYLMFQGNSTNESGTSILFNEEGTPVCNEKYKRP